MEDIALLLEASPALKVYDHRDSVSTAKGPGPRDADCDPMQLIRMGGSRMIGYCVNRTDDGVRIRNVSSGLPASVAGLRVGDWVSSVDGRPVSEGPEVWTVRDAVTAGRQQHLLLETRRGAESRWYLLVK